MERDRTLDLVGAIGLLQPWLRQVRMLSSTRSLERFPWAQAFGITAGCVRVTVRPRV